LSYGLELAKIDITNPNDFEEFLRRHAAAHLVLFRSYASKGLKTYYADLSRFTPQWNAMHRAMHLDLCLKAKLASTSISNFNPKLRNAAMVFAMRNADEHVRLSKFAGL